METAFSSLKTILRVSAGIALLLLGLISLLIPLLQGTVLILISLPLLNPAHGKRLWNRLYAFYRRHADRKP